MNKFLFFTYLNDTWGIVIDNLPDWPDYSTI